MAYSNQIIPFGEYRPDVSDLNAQYTSSVLNVRPRGDGYGPFAAPQAFTSALAAPCRGYFYGRIGDQIVIFAGTETRLYRLDNSTLTWTDVSAGGSAYSSLPSDGHWQFAQFGNFVIAVQVNAPPQVYDVTLSSAFADLGGSPPRARYISIISTFVVLSGLLDNPYRVHWSGESDVTQWTAGVGLSDFQDIPDGGMVRGVVGGEFGIIIQDTAIRRMVFVPGSDIIFQIERIARDIGALAPYSIVNASDRMFFLSPRGFVMADMSGQVHPIGKERVDRTFLATYDSASLHMVIGASDPSTNTVMWASKSLDGGIVGQFDTIHLYDWVLDRWSKVTTSGQYLAFMGAPGYTIESLDALTPGAVVISGAANNGSGLVRLTVASTSGWTTGDIKTVSGVLGTTEANGTWAITVVDATHIDLQGSAFSVAYTSGGVVSGSIDALSFSLDAVAASTLAQLSCVNTSNEVCLFNGANLESVLETAEYSLMHKRMLINEVMPITDGTNVYVSIGTRDRRDAAFSYGEEALMDEDGHCSLLEEGRWVRAKMRIPAAEVWEHATGVLADTVVAGEV